MVCRRCGEKGAVDSAGFCEECAQREVALSSGVVKTSTIVVAAGEDTTVYRSVKEIPPELRRQLRRATNSVNSGTILIADKRGREQIARAMRKLPEASGDAEPSRVWSPRVQQGVAVALIVCTLILILLVVTNRF
jgi:hypothetical protein